MLGQEVAERLVGQDLDEPSGDVDADRVVPPSARVERQRQLGDRVDDLGERAGRVVHDPVLPVELGDRVVDHEVVGEPARVGEQVTDRGRPRRVDE